MVYRGDDVNPFAAPEMDLRSQAPLPGEGPMEYGGFFQRWISSIVDSLILMVIVFPISFVIGFAYGIVKVGMFGQGYVGDLSDILFRLAMQFLSFLVGLFYYALQESSDSRATPGKKMMGLAVVNLDGGKVTFGQAIGRYFGKLLSGVILGIGFLIQPFTEKRQALHDILASTLVVKVRR